MTHTNPAVALKEISITHRRLQSKLTLSLSVRVLGFLQLISQFGSKK